MEITPPDWPDGRGRKKPKRPKRPVRWVEERRSGPRTWERFFLWAEFVGGNWRLSERSTFEVVWYDREITPETRRLIKQLLTLPPGGDMPIIRID